VIRRCAEMVGPQARNDGRDSQKQRESGNTHPRIVGPCHRGSRQPVREATPPRVIAGSLRGLIKTAGDLPIGSAVTAIGPYRAASIPTASHLLLPEALLSTASLLVSQFG
jgi:hypothetical protein